jgi:hypothetical protein
LLGAQTAMPVVEAKNRMAVAADPGRWPPDP